VRLLQNTSISGRGGFVNDARPETEVFWVTLQRKKFPEIFPSAQFLGDAGKT